MHIEYTDKGSEKVDKQNKVKEYPREIEKKADIGFTLTELQTRFFSNLTLMFFMLYPLQEKNTPPIANLIELEYSSIDRERDYHVSVTTVNVQYLYWSVP